MQHIWRKIRTAYKIQIGKHKWKRPHQRSRNRWENNDIKSDFKETGCESMDWIELVEDIVSGGL